MPARRHSLPANVSRPVDVLDVGAKSAGPSPAPNPVGLQAPVAAAASPAAKPEPNELFLEPIYLELMADPVFCSDKKTYDRSTFAAFPIGPEGKFLSPFTRLPIENHGANIALRSAIWDAHPEQKALYKRPPEFTYTGHEDADGKAHGAGRRTYLNGTKEESEFVHGVLHERSRKVGSGNKQTGTFVDGQLHGMGGQTFAIGHKVGQVHSGTYEHGKLRQGRIVYPDGSEHEGAFEDDTLHGHGMIKSPDKR